MAVNFGQNEINCAISDCKSNKGTIYDFVTVIEKWNIWMSQAISNQNLSPFLIPD